MQQIRKKYFNHFLCSEVCIFQHVLLFWLKTVSQFSIATHESKLPDLTPSMLIHIKIFNLKDILHHNGFFIFNE